MSTINLDDFFCQIPDYFKVELSGISFDDCDRDGGLNGDFLVPYVSEGPQQHYWRLDFPEVCGYQILTVIVRPNRMGYYSLRILLSGKRGTISWIVANAQDFANPLEAQLSSQTSKSESWPQSVTVTSIGFTGQTTQANLANARVPVLSIGATGSYDGSSVSDICMCWGAGYEKWMAAYSGITNVGCDDCGSLNQTVELIISSPNCDWYGFSLITCGFSMHFLELTRDSNGEYRLHLVLIDDGGQVDWDLRGKDLDFTQPLTLSFLQYVPGDVNECDFDSSVAVITPVGPANAADYDNIDCWNKWGNCSCKLEVFTNEPTVDDSNCTIEVLCCPCSCGSSDMGAGSLQNSGCGCEVCVDQTSGSVVLNLDLTTNFPGSATNSIAYNSSDGTQQSSTPSTGARTASIVDENLVTFPDTVVRIYKCDNSVLYYECPDENGVFKSKGRNPNTLRLSGGTYLETQGNGLLYDFGGGGPLVRICKDCNQPITTTCSGANTSIWTMTRNSPLSSVTDPYGRRTTYSYDGSNHLKRIEDPFNRITTFTMDASGYLTKRITPELCATEMKYDANGKLTALVTPDGCRTSFGYNTDGWCEYQEDPTGARTTLTYVSWEKTRVTNPAGQVTTLLFDAGRNLKGIINPLGEQTDYSYSHELTTSASKPGGPRVTYVYKTLSGNRKSLEATVTATGRSTYVYDSNDRVVATINPLGNRTTTIRNTAGKTVAMENPLGHRTSYVFDSDGRKIATINPLGNRTSVVYNSVGEITATIDPLGRRTSYTYANGQQQTVENPSGEVTTTLYDLMGRPTATINPLGARTSMLYDSGCRLLATVNPLGHRTTNIYNCARLVATIDRLGNRTTFGYDVQGRRVRTQNPLGNITTTVYDAASRVVATIDPLGHRSTTVYNTADQAVASIDPLGRRSTSVYDTAGRVVANINPENERTTTVYNAANQVVANINPLGNRTTAIYNAAGRTIASIDALGNRTTSVYDAAGEGIASINALGYRTTSTYNAAGQGLASINPLANRSTTVYDAGGRPVAGIDPLGNRTTSVYDGASRVIASIDPLGIRTSSVFNAAGQTMANVDGEGARTSYTYDAAGQQIAVQDARGNLSTTVYDAAGQTVANVDGLSHRTTLGYDAAGRSITTKTPMGK